MSSITTELWRKCLHCGVKNADNLHCRGCGYKLKAGPGPYRIKKATR